MKKRVLWLSNDTLRRQYEVPCLIEAGYEVYCPKICGYGLGESWLSVSDEFDSSLSLPDEVLSELNAFDLYSPLSPRIMGIINQYFDFVMVTPMVSLLRELIHHYRGVIILRWVGDEEGRSCTERLILDGGYNLLFQLDRIKNRLFFGYTLKDGLKDECEMLQGRQMHLPLPLCPENYSDDTVKNEVLFIAPNICLDNEVNTRFRAYHRLLSMPFRVFGEQLVPSENYQELFVGNNALAQRNAVQRACLAIDPGNHSTLLSEPWVQMLRAGVPLLYTSDSKAKEFLGRGGPGFCTTEKDVVKKAEKINDNDGKLKEAILSWQRKKTADYTMEKCNETWAKAINRLEEDIRLNSCYRSRKKKVCVILPTFYLGGVLTFTNRFVLSLHEEIVRHHAPVELIFAHIPSEEYKARDSFAKIRKAGIPIREILSENMAPPAAKKMLEMAGLQPLKIYGDLPVLSGVLYNDGVHMLMDCDYLINMTDRSGLDAPTNSLYAYAVIAHDYIQRYSFLPKDYIYIPMGRNADRVFVTSEPTYTDALQYAMVKKERLTLLPILYEMLGEKEEWRSPTFEDEEDELDKELNKKKSKKEIRKEILNNKPFFLWSTNCSRHKNHMAGLKALNKYYKDGGTLMCHVTGALSHFMNPKEDLSPYQGDSDFFNYLSLLQKYISEHTSLHKHLIFDKYVSEYKFKSLLARACFTFHPGFADNGNGTALDAASLGVPTLSNDYPAMRYLSDYAQIHCVFTDVNDTDAAAEALLDMERNHEAYADALDYDAIEKHSLKYIQETLYDRLAWAIGFDLEVQQ